MNTFEAVVTVVLVIAYTAFSVWAMTQFRKISTAIAGSLCLAAGGVGVYFAGAFVAALLLALLELLFSLGVIYIIYLIFFN